MATPLDLLDAPEFADDRLTESINIPPYATGRPAQLGIFTDTPINTTYARIAIEEGEAAATAAEKGVAALESLKAALETSKDASEDLTKQVELAAQESRHALSNIKASLDGIAGRLDRGRP